MAALHLRDASWFDLLGRLGRELPGVLKLFPEGITPSELQTYRPLTTNTLSARLAGREQVPLLLSNAQSGMSLAGAQDKITVRFDPKTRSLSDSLGDAPTTHILKPDTRQARYQPSAINEYACMPIAALAWPARSRSFSAWHWRYCPHGTPCKPVFSKTRPPRRPKPSCCKA